MLPGFLVSTYKKYKQDTSIFVEWLSENAGKCGHKLPEVAAKPAEVPAAAPRLKGKARKLAKQAGGISAAPSTPKEAPIARHLISTKDFLSYAKAIAESVSSQVNRFKSSKCPGKCGKSNALIEIVHASLVVVRIH